MEPALLFPEGRLKNPCSTPYGIKGIGTELEAAATPPKNKCSTPYGIKGIGTREAITTYPTARQCSTPYGIKGIGTLHMQAWHSCDTAVLNALRHQRNWNNPPAPSLSLLESVLNALRHQRNWNILTPAPTDRKSARVLNALRHQRNWNCKTAPTIHPTIQCSTPYGIKGIGTRWRSFTSGKAASAQRLTASKELEQAIE